MNMTERRNLYSCKIIKPVTREVCSHVMGKCRIVQEEPRDSYRKIIGKNFQNNTVKGLVVLKDHYRA